MNKNCKNCGHQLIKLSQARFFSRKVIAEALMADPYQSLTDHITDMRTRMDQVQERLQTAPVIKASAEDAAPEMDLATLFADLTQGIELLENKLGGDDDIEPELHKGIEELENKLWELEEKLGLTPKLSEHEKEEPEHKEVVEKAEEMDKEASEIFCKNTDCKRKATVRRSDGNWCEKHAPAMPEKKEAAAEPFCPKCDALGNRVRVEKYVDGYECTKGHKLTNEELHKEAAGAIQQTDETITTNDPNAIQNSFTPDPTAPPTLKNIQPTDDDNLEVPVVKPSSPPAPGQIWQWNSTVGKYVSMPDPANPGKTI